MRKMYKHHAQNAQTSCAKCTNIMRKIHKHHAQNAQTSCAKYTNIMRKIHKHHAQNTQMLCKMQRRYAQNEETLCSKCGSSYYAQNSCSMLKNAETLCSIKRTKLCSKCGNELQMRHRGCVIPILISSLPFVRATEVRYNMT